MALLLPKNFELSNKIVREFDFILENYPVRNNA